MKTTHTDFKPLNQYEKAALLKELEEDPAIESASCGNVLMLRDGENIRIFTIVKEEIISNECD